jgi:hypothetical protein
MIGNDRFVQVFGSVPAGDDTLLVQIVSNAVREGFWIVLCEPGTDVPMCTLPPAKARLEHECGLHHVLSLESLLVTRNFFDPWYDPGHSHIDGPNGWSPKDKAKVRAKVSAVINRVTKAHDGVKPNIGVVPGPSGYVVTTGSETPVFPTVRCGTWDRRWYWFSLPNGARMDDYTASILVPPSTTKWGPLQLIGQTSPAPEWLLERIAERTAHA